MADPARAPTRDPRTLLPEDGFFNFLTELRREVIEQAGRARARRLALLPGRGMQKRPVAGRSPGAIDAYRSAP